MQPSSFPSLDRAVDNFLLQYRNTAPPQEDVVDGEEVINSIQTIADVEEESEEDGDAEQGTLRNRPNTNQILSSTDEASATQSKSRTEQPEEDSRILRRAMRITEQRWRK